MAAATTAAAVLGLALALAACGGNGSSASNAHRSTSSSPTYRSVAGDFDIGRGKHLHLECSAGDGPTVVLEVGDEDTVSGSWEAVYQPMTSTGRVCAYDRANLGLSDPDPGPRTVQDVADNLVTLLHVAKVPGPYVFVGGSLGGNIVGVLAANHPEEVAGLVFVDSDPANDDPALDPFRRNLSAKVYRRCCAPGLFMLPYDDPKNVEHIDWEGGHAAEVASISHLPKVPTVVLTAARPDCDPTWPCRAIALDDFRLQAEWIKGNPRGTHLLVDSGHVMQREAPQAILDATATVVKEISAT